MENVTLIMPLEATTVNNTSDSISDSISDSGVTARVTVEQHQERW